VQCLGPFDVRLLAALGATAKQHDQRPSSMRSFAVVTFAAACASRPSNQSL